MSTGHLLVLGAIAGGTIFIGLPMGRLRSPRPEVSAMPTPIAVGILAFLLVDVLPAAMEPVEDALTAAHESGGSFVTAGGLCFVFAGGLILGLMSLVYYDRWRDFRLSALT